MTPRSRLLSLAAAATLAAVPLTGCGSGSDGETSGGPPPEQVVASGDPAAGEQVYADNCASCHGGDGGGGTGPKLEGDDEYTDAEVVVSQIRDGGGGMPGFADQLSAQELADVSAFVTKDLAAK